MKITPPWSRDGEPTANSDCVADVLAIEFAAVVGTHVWILHGLVPIPFSLGWSFGSDFLSEPDSTASTDHYLVRGLRIAR